MTLHLPRLLLAGLCVALVGCELFQDPPVDRDGDGYPSDEDCDDDNPNVHPDAPELCDDVDSDCDGEAADAHSIDAAIYHPDLDNDGRGDPGGALTSCTQPTGYVVDDTDCDDTTPRVSPDVAEICDTLDNDCDGQIDEADARNAPTWHLDLDEDGFGDPDTPGTTACDGPDGHAANGDDCNDSDPEINPAATETWYDGIDQDCDGWSDSDQDRDGHDSVDQGGADCDDDDGTVHPDAEEICNDGIDNDCDGGANTCGMHGALSVDTARTRITGEDSRDQIGSRISSAGDANGDGLTDLLVDAHYSDLGGDDAGAVYLAHGPLAAGELGLEASAAVMVGESEGDQLGSAIVAGDLNADGYSDVILTSVNSAASGVAGGAAYIILGPISGGLHMADADARIAGTTLAMHLGYSATLVSDQDGDMLADLALSAPLYGDSTGYIAIVSGANLGQSDIDDVTLSSMTGPEPMYSLGSSLVAIDWDGDGSSELVMGAPDWSGESDIHTGAVIGATLPLPASPEDGDWTIAGPAEQSYFGITVVSAGDLDDDGLEDLLIGATGLDDSADDAGAVYLFLGPLEGEVDASDADTIFLGLAEADALGRVMLAAGDLNDDGIPELAFGAPTHTPDSTLSTEAGLVMLFPGDLRGIIEGGAGIEASIHGEDAGDAAGSSLTSLGDADGDGIDDLLIGTPYQDTAGPNAGAVYLLTGGGI